MMFDTRDKKPKLWNIAILSAVMVLAVTVLAFTGNGSQTSVKAMNTILLIYLVLVIILLIAAFFRQLQYNPYSYNTIYYIGFALFLLSVLISQIRAFIFSVVQGNSYSLQLILLDLSISAVAYMIYTAPFVLIFSIALFVSNIVLLRHEGFRISHLLGILLSALMVGGELFLFFVKFRFPETPKEGILQALLINLFAAFYLYCESMVAGSLVADFIAAKYEPEKDKDYIIILGCRPKDDGTPTPILRGRVERAYEFYKKQIEETGKAPLLIPSGGKGDDEVISESESMAICLKELGVPEEHIRKEEQSTTTYENMVFSKKIIDGIDPKGKIAFSTSNFHVFRSGLLARRVKMRALGMGAKTKWYYWPNAGVREFASLLSQHRLKQALILSGMIILYTLLTIGAQMIAI